MTDAEHFTTPKDMIEYFGLQHRYPLLYAPKNNGCDVTWVTGIQSHNCELLKGHKELHRCGVCKGQFSNKPADGFRWDMATFDEMSDYLSDEELDALFENCDHRFRMPGVMFESCTSCGATLRRLPHIPEPEQTDREPDSKE